MGRETKVGHANLLSPNFYVLPAFSSQLSVFSKLCIMSTLLHFLLLFQLCRSLRNIPLGGRILGKSKVIITVGWVWWYHLRTPLFSLASGPPNPKPTIAEIVNLESSLHRHCFFRKPELHNFDDKQFIFIEIWASHHKDAKRNKINGPAKKNMIMALEGQQRVRSSILKLLSATIREWIALEVSEDILSFGRQ